MLLQGNKISKSYNKIDVLNNVDISVSSGEIVVADKNLNVIGSIETF